MVVRVLICEMFSFYSAQGISLLDKLEKLYQTYGYCLNTLHSYEFEGSAGFAKMQEIMQKFRSGVKNFAGKKGGRTSRLCAGKRWSSKIKCAEIPS